MSPYSIHSEIAKQFLVELEIEEYDDFFDCDTAIRYDLSYYNNEVNYDAA